MIFIVCFFIFLGIGAASESRRRRRERIKLEKDLLQIHRSLHGSRYHD